MVDVFAGKVSIMTVDFEVIPNRRNMAGEHPEPFECEHCGSKTSAFIKINRMVSGAVVNNIIICKGCLLKAVDFIDHELLEQSKTRVN